MATFTLADLVGYIRQAAGEDEDFDLDGDIGEITFANLGYDSIAMVEVVVSVERELGISLPGEGTDKDSTPTKFVEVVNELMPASVQP
ncbi:MULTISPECIES: phosphopantetheine-binding protein [Actinomadura]|uniref:Acyl carrier protein n=1 Tax=Actinomadura litoris TaxID=2678616 RepID=A0A7K1L0N6_9ACTN|nr:MULTISPECIES: phosphopantetheine-binding protein [Actinomadura]MBT2206897.1 acyl carrier protein [Actinomadura sp. NEAU-AAG7]MUN38002.1 acyl carrier protein [Actinomadura litoris]